MPGSPEEERRPRGRPSQDTSAHTEDRRTKGSTAAKQRLLAACIDLRAALDPLLDELEQNRRRRCGERFVEAARAVMGSELVVVALKRGRFRLSVFSETQLGYAPVARREVEVAVPTARMLLEQLERFLLERPEVA